jgi:non-specific serine/threonine protein kinase
MPDLPSGVSVRYGQQYRRCGKRDCLLCSGGGRGHGPYWFAYWQEDGRKRSLYLGKQIPAAVAAETGGGAAPLRDRTAAPTATIVARLRVRALGAFCVWRGDDLIPAEQWKRRKAVALFKFLLAAPGYRMTREQVIERLWPEADPVAGAHNARTTVHLLRGILDVPGGVASYVRTTGDLMELVPDPQATQDDSWLDAAMFRHAVGRALAGHDAAACRAALALYTGPYLQDDGAEEWAVRVREDLQERYGALLLHLATLCLRSAEQEEAVQALTTILRLDPCHEEAARLLMQVHLTGGRPSLAIRVYRRLVTALREDLDLAPEAETQALYNTARKRLPPAPDAPSTTGSQPVTNLPAALTSFLGRRQELAALRTLLTTQPIEIQPDALCRLITLTGPGGCGKSRLAYQVADEVLEDYGDGVWVAELAPLSDPALVIQTVAAAVGLQYRDKADPDQHGLIASLCGYLRPKRLLLVLDNCEHLVESCAGLAGALLSACPHLRILATSREALGVLGEQPWRVPRLSLPDTPAALLSQISHYEAVRLFLERARVHQPGLDLTAQNAPHIVSICRQLDGMPLAIELAAARVAVLSIDAIAARLDDRFRLLTTGNRTALPRHRTLRAALDWSYDLLIPPEQALLRRLATFAGGWSLEAAESVCGDEQGAEVLDPGVDRAPVLDLLASLVAKSLVQTESTGETMRYSLLETVRQYGRERLVAAREEHVCRARHLAWYAQRLGAADTPLQGPEQVALLTWLDQEHDNVRAALRWARDTGASESGLRIAGAIWRFWVTRGYLTEGRQWLDSLLAQLDTGTTIDSALHTRALNGAGALAYYQADYSRAAACYAQCLDLSRSRGDRRGMARALNNLGLVRKDEGDYAAALGYYQEALVLYQELGDQHGCAVALGNLGIATGDLGNSTQAEIYHEESLALKRRLGDTLGVITSLNNLGVVTTDLGNFARAEALLSESLALAQQLDNRWSTHVSLSNFARLAYVRGDYPRALRHYQESLAICHQVGNDLYSANQLEGIASVLCAVGAMAQAVTLCGAAMALCQRSGASLPASDRLLHDRTVAAAHAALGDAFDAAWMAGYRRDRQAAIELGLALILPHGN